MVSTLAARSFSWIESRDELRISGNLSHCAVYHRRHSRLEAVVFQNGPVRLRPYARHPTPEKDHLRRDARRWRLRCPDLLLPLQMQLLEGDQRPDDVRLPAI
jgi:hypothetical protein